MLIFKIIDSTRNLDNKSYDHMKFYAMASVRGEEGNVPFVECIDEAQAKEAKKKGRTIVGIAAISITVPFVEKNINYVNDNVNVNVSGALKFKIKPNEAFRDFVLHYKDVKRYEGEMTVDQLIVEFADSSYIGLDDYLNHVINTEVIGQIRKHGGLAMSQETLNGLAEKLHWCEVTELKLELADNSRDAKNVWEIKNKQNEKSWWEIIIENLIDILIFWGRNVKEVLTHPIDSFSKFRRQYFITLIVALFAAWALRMIVFVLGGGSPFARKCSIEFVAKETASSNLQKYLLTEKFRQEVKSKGEAFSDINIGGKPKHLKEADAQALSSWVENYVGKECYGTLCFIKNDYNHPHGIPKILGWSTPHYKCVVGMEGKLASDPYRVIVNYDYDNSVTERINKMFLMKGTSKNGVTEYKALKLRLEDIEFLERTLQNDPALKSKGVTVLRGPASDEITITVVNYTLNYQLDISALDDSYVDEVKSVVKSVLSRDIYFEKGVSKPMPLAISEVERFKKALGVRDKVKFEREEKEAGKAVCLVFELTDKERKILDIIQKNKEEKIAWWKNEEQKWFDAVTAAGRQFERDVMAFKVPETVSDGEYKRLLEGLRKLSNAQNDNVIDLVKLDASISDYQKGMEGKIQKRAEEHKKKLKELSALYGSLKNHLNVQGIKLDAANWETKAVQRFNAIKANVRQLEMDVASIKVPEGASDAEYRKIQAQIQLLREKRQENVLALEGFISEVHGVREAETRKRAAKYKEPLAEQSALLNRLQNRLESLSRQIDDASWKAKAQREIIRRHEAIEKATKEYEQTLTAEETGFAKDIPATIQVGQTKQYYENLERLALQWEAKCRETFTRIEEYRNSSIKETFMLDNRMATMDVKSYKSRVNAVLTSWASMCAKAMNCTQDCRYRRVELSFQVRQAEFWKNVEALGSLDQKIKAMQAKIQAKRQELEGMTYAEAKSRRNEIQSWFNNEILVPRKNAILRLRSLAAYFSGLQPQNEWGSTLTYDNSLGRKVLNSPEVRQLDANALAKVQALLDAQESRLVALNMGSRNNALSELKNRAEVLEGLVESLTLFDKDDKLGRLIKL